MTSKTFVDKETIIDADWLNDVDRLAYGPATKTIAKTLTPVDGAKIYPQGTDGGVFIGGTNVAGYYDDDGGTAYGTRFKPSSGITDGTVGWERDWDGTNAYLEWFGAQERPFDSGVIIQTALGIKSRNLKVINGSIVELYSTTAIEITGISKVLDIQGASLTFEFEDKVGIDITAPAAETKYSGIHNAQLWFNLCTGNANIGVRMSGKTRNLDNRNVVVNYVGLSRSGGIGYEIVGATAGNSPFFGSHQGIICNQCYSGFYLHGINGDLSSDVTTQHFLNCYAPSCNSFGLKVEHSSNNTFENLSIESTTGNAVIQDDCQRNQFFGGIIEGSGGADWVESNRRDVTNLNLVMSNYGTLDITKYENLPDVYFGGRFQAKRLGMPLVGLTNTGIIQFTGVRGVLTVQTRRGGWARFLLSTTVDTTTKQVTILESFVSGDAWTVTKGSANSLNVYWNAVDSKWELENLSTLSQTVSCQLLAE